MDSMFLKTCKRALVAALRAWFRYLNIFSLAGTVVKNWPKLRAARNIVLYPHGGFGHTLIAPDWIRRLYPDDNNIVLFGSWEGRHNRSTPLIWQDTLILVPMSNSFPGIGIIANWQWSETLFRAVGVVMRKLWPEKRILYFVDDMMDVSPRPEFVSKSDFFATRIECYYYHQVVTRTAPKPELPPRILAPMKEDVYRLRPEGLTSTCNLYLRAKGKNRNDLSDTRRNSAGIEDYLSTVRYLNTQGYQVLLTGDIELPQNLREEFAGAVIDWRDVETGRDLYQLFAGLYTDIHIGGFSGGSAYVHIADIPSLMIDGFAFGEALPFSTVLYKRLRAKDGSIVPPHQLISDFFFDYDCEGFELIDNTPEEILSAVMDWLPHAKPRLPYGVDARELGVKCPWLTVADARLSPVWLSGFQTEKMTKNLSSSATG